MKNDEFWTWIHNHINESPASLILKFHGKFPWIDKAVMQIQCRRKARKKLEQELACPQFYFPSTLSAEQCTGDRLATFHSSLIKENDTVLDLTGGLGIDSFHFALIARSVTVIEKMPSLCEALRHNADVLKITNIKIVNDDSSDFLSTTSEYYDTIFIDPARRGAEGERVYGLSDCSPDVLELLPYIKTRCRRLIVKASPMLDITQLIRELPGASAVYAAGNDTECKELVTVIDFGGSSEEPVIHALSTSSDFSFKRSEETAAEAVIAGFQPAGYLYEPNPEIMKTAPFRLLSSKFNIAKLSPNTHLYCSENLIPEFPGTILNILEVIDYTSANIKRFSKKYPVIRIAARNFGMTAEQLRKKLNTKDGGTLRLFAATIYPDKKIMIVTSEIGNTL